jgi:hypothetical protein
MSNNDLNNYLEEIGETVIVATGFEDAVIGISYRMNELLAVYSYEKMVAVLMRRDGMDYEEAMEFLDNNVIFFWVGEKTPIVVKAIPAS